MWREDSKIIPSGISMLIVYLQPHSQVCSNVAREYTRASKVPSGLSVNSGIKVSQKAGGRDRGASALPIPPLDWLPYVLKHTWGGLDGFIAYLRLPRLPGSYPSV